MNTQIFNRLGVAHVRDTMEQFVNGTLTRGQAMDSLRIGFISGFDCFPDIPLD